MFKADWEKAGITAELPIGLIEEIMEFAYPKKRILSKELIAGGCSNLNIKFFLEDEKQALLLRVYLRDKDAAFREQKLGHLLKHTVPVPLIESIDEFKGYRFAITEFLSGLSLRDLLLGEAPYDIKTIMNEVGTVLSKIASHQFSEAGVFDKELNVTPYKPSDVLGFVQECLTHKTVTSTLTPKTILEISKILDQCGFLFPDENEKHLAHGDFDPANILVDKMQGVWKVVSVLDWEFSFSGSVLWDIANMLRYAHKMPPEFQNYFLKGLEKSGIKLPDTWRASVHLLNLSSLLDCLKRSDQQIHPNRCDDIQDLISHILIELKSYA